MKKLLSLFIVLVLAFTCLVACGDTTDSSHDHDHDHDHDHSHAPAAPSAIRIAGLKGPTSMGLVKLMEENSKGLTDNKYEFTVAGTADEISPNLIQGNFDIAAIPCNLASVLYNKTGGEIQLLAVNNLSVLYIVTKNETVYGISDLIGKTIYATGKGSTPEYTLRYILAKNGIDPDKDVTIEFKTEPAEVVAMFKTSESGIAMLPQPYVTVAMNSVEGLAVSLDLGSEWTRVDKSGSEVVTGVIVVRKAFAEQYPDAVIKFLTEYSVSVRYPHVNLDDAAQLVEKYGIISADIAKSALPACRLYYMAGDEMKTAVSGYLKVLFDQNPASVGGAMPGDDFYYGLE